MSRTSLCEAYADAGANWNVWVVGVRGLGASVCRQVMPAPKTPPITRKGVPALAARQHGVVARRQLREIGVHRDTIDAWLRRGRLHTIHRGVYALGHPWVDGIGMLFAALLACGAHSFLGGRTALAWHGVLAYGGKVCVVRPGRGSARGPAPIEVSRMRSVHPSDFIVTDQGLRVASLARALVDSAGLLTEQQLKKAIKEAEFLRLLDVGSVLAALERTPNRAGAAALRKALGAGEQLPSREEFVLRFLELCERAGLPRPSVDVWMDTGLPTLGQVDLVFRDARVIIELDGARAHLTRARFEEDRRRNSYLTARGWTTLRYTWRRVNRDASAVTRELRQLVPARITDAGD